MEKNRLLILPFLAGLLLMGYSWYLSYPIASVSARDIVFNHISILYWFSLPLLLASMFLIAVTTKSNFLKWLLSIGIVLTFFSLFYFYYMMPTGDSQYFRGLTEYFVSTKNLDSSQLVHDYYQWPAFFILADIVTSVSGLPLINYEFLIYTLIAVLLTTGLYLYASKKHNLSGFIMVAVFFMSVYYFLDYQAVPYSLALGLLFLLFVLETFQNSASLIIMKIVLFAGLLITHFFVPLFYVLYLMIRALLDRQRQSRSFYTVFFLLALVSYFLVQITIARFSFGQLIVNLTKTPMSYSNMAAAATGTAVPNAINIVAQFFSRTVTVSVVVICVVGFVFLLLKRKMGNLEKAIFSTGAFYVLFGIVLNTLGERGIPLLFIPLSLGATYLLKIRFRRYFIGFLLILLILFLFVPLHQAFNNEIQFQTREAYIADNFFIENYNWKNPGLVVSDFRTNTYLVTKLSATEYIQPGLQIGEKPDAILYSPQFVGLDLGNYTSMESLSQGEKLTLTYNDGFSYILINGQH
jgi:hypothetical protein